MRVDPIVNCLHGLSCVAWLSDRSNRLLDALPHAFKCRESPDGLTGLPVQIIRYHPDKFSDYIALRPMEETNALPPI